MDMRLTLLGTGDAAGMPLYGCDCAYCKAARKNPMLKRTPCSALLEVGEQHYLLDAGQSDLCERFPFGTLDGIFLTHFHPDHVQGLFHLRWGIGQSLPVYTPPDAEGCLDLYKHPGMLDFITQRKFESFRLADLEITPVPLLHSKPHSVICSSRQVNALPT
jgi:phosphoribosyl 1,2-cyclic phosphate phosphodiesterase